MQLGTIEGKVNTSSFKFRATEEVRKFDFISVKSNGKWILGQVEEVTKKSSGETIANANIIGYRDKGLTKAPRRVIEPDSIVYRADQELISDTLGLKDSGLRIGNLETNEDIDIFVNKDDFYKHFAVLAQTGAGKCVTPETPVIKSNGSLKKIKEIFQSSDHVAKSSEEEELRILDNCSVKALDDEYNQVDADALYAYRKKADKVLRIKTSSGREVEVTPEHPLLSAEENYGFVEARELEEGGHIAVPRELETTGTSKFAISEDLRAKAREESDNREKLVQKFEEFRAMDKEGTGLTEIANELAVSKSTLENWKYEGMKPLSSEGLFLTQNSKGIEVPEIFSPEFAEFLSLVIAEGTEQHADGSYRIIFTNNDESLMEKFVSHADSLFGLETHGMRDKSRYIGSTSLKYLLEDVGYKPLQKSRSKQIPDIVLKSPRECKKRFLRAFFDAEGCMENHEVTLSSASEDIINKLSYLLLEFGIVARMSETEKEATNSDHEGDIYYRIAISGREQLEKFSGRVGFGIDRKQDKLERYMDGKEDNTNTDVVPVDGEYLKTERNKVGISQENLGDKIGSHSTLISLYERNKRRPSRGKFEKLAETLDSALYNDLASSDVFWDKIESIEAIDYEGYVYDLTVREHHNFIAGKGGIVCHNSYLTGVLIEEMLEKDLPVMVIDPHGEYHSLGVPNPENKEEQRSYEINEYSPNTDINQEALPLSFSEINMEKKEILEVLPDSLTNSQMGVLYNALKRLRDKGDDYNLTDLMDAVSQEESSAKWNLLNSLEQLDESNLFSEDPVDLESILTPGEATVVNLRAVEPETAEMTMYSLAKRMFDLRKKNLIPPFIMVIEEAHNFAPEKGFEQALSNKILRKIASEGRKFGLGIGVISQRPARIDKNVLSQCNTQFILRVTNPNDLKAISKSFEGVTSEVESMIKSLPPGVCFVLGNEYPVMTDVRTRKSKHGGTTQTSETYIEKTKIRMFKPRRTKSQIETKRNQKYDVAYYPLYRVESDDKLVLVDAVSGEIKAEIEKLSGNEKKVHQKLSEGKGKSEIMDDLDVGIGKITGWLDSLRDKGRVKEDEVAIEDTIFDFDIVEERVEQEQLIDRQLSEDDVTQEGDKKLVYYPYYSRDDHVYDPILDKELD
ncbi:MAG: helicase HerA domain-containing protein [Candidatus Nanohaloarchaea archaeon]